MDLSCIISSGDLELYVLGMLPQDEARKIEQLALLFPEIQEELDRISLSLLQVAEESTVTPAPAVKSSLMAQLQALKEAEDALAAPVIPLQTGRHTPRVSEQQSEEPVVRMNTSESNRRVWLSAAGFIGLLLAVGALLVMIRKTNDQRSEIAGLQQNVRSLNRNVVELQRQNLASNQMLNMLQNDTYKKIRLTSVPGKPDALAQVFWNTLTKEVFLNDVSLPTAPTGQQYQLWAIVDGKPVDAGMLQNGKNTVQQMKTLARAEAFAITLEKAGGSPTPTMEAMYVMGGVS